jgi:hypothetical protein
MKMLDAKQKRLDQLWEIAQREDACQNLVPNDIRYLIRAAREAEDARQIVELINDLRRDEGDQVIICHDNPDFTGPPCVVYTIGRFGNQMPFYGDSILKCLEAAKYHRSRESKI